MKKLSLLDSTVINMSSAAPLYSIIVTVVLIVPLLGLYTPLAFLIAALLMLTLSKTMQELNTVYNDQGTVYMWAKGTMGVIAGKFGGYLLALTGILALASSAQLAGEAALNLINPDHDDNKWSLIILSVLLLLGITYVRIPSHDETGKGALDTITQNLLMVIQIGGVLVLLYSLLSQGFTFPTSAVFSDVTFNWLNLVHGTMLAFFIFWGWDTSYSLTEESEDDVPEKASKASIMWMFLLYTAVSVAYVMSSNNDMTSNPIVNTALLISCLASIRTTLIPTTRTFVSMARQKDLPSFFLSTRNSNLTGLGVSIAWLILTVTISEDFFYDSIEATSFFVVAYYLLSAVAYTVSKDTRKNKLLAGVSISSMSLILIITLGESFIPSYGSSEPVGAGFFGTEGIGMIGVLTVGFLLLFGLFLIKKPQPVRNPR